MALRHAATTIGTTAAPIEGTQYPGWVMKNIGSAAVYLGDSTVTISTGFPIEPNEVFSPSELSHRQTSAGVVGDRLYGIASAGGNSIRVLIPGKVRT
jgi:hypothetical protein